MTYLKSVTSSVTIAIVPQLSYNMKSQERYNHVSLVSERFKLWETEYNNRFSQLKSNEEELNRIFIDIYGLQDELTPEVE